MPPLPTFCVATKVSRLVRVVPAPRKATTLQRPKSSAKPSRTVESVLAHAHLRLGALSLARVELETMAGLGLLDSRGLVDLAEVR